MGWDTIQTPQCLRVVRRRDAGDEEDGVREKTQWRQEIPASFRLPGSCEGPFLLLSTKAVIQSRLEGACLCLALPMDSPGTEGRKGLVQNGEGTGHDPGSVRTGRDRSFHF